LRKNLLSGFIILLPITITIWFARFFIDLLTDPFLQSAQNLLLLIAKFDSPIYTHPLFLLVLTRFFILILLFLFVVLLGYLAQKIVFNWAMKKIHLIFLKIPLINSIYRACKDIISAVFSTDSKVFNQVVLVPFPSKESRTIGLVAGHAASEIQEKLPSPLQKSPLKVVFVATSPHPTSGFLLLVAEENIVNLDISLEDAFKFLISCGIFLPGHKAKKSI
jgi:uncharacterized membrane protein